MDSPASRSAADDLALIRRMMNAGRQKAAFDGAHLMIWGAVLMVSYIAQYLQVYGYVPGGSLAIWLPAFAVGWSSSFLYGRNACAHEAETNIAVTAYNGAWLAVGITMVLHFGAAVASSVFNPKAITVLACGVIASAFYVISLVTELRALRAVAAGWWLILIFATVQKTYDAEMLLVLAGASALLILLPGQMMRRLAHDKAAES
ncbi:MAG: hypothetical protein JJ850_04530 [Kordiimonadaceae bacterium]|nr:hypothetical protein [Kordiimonadaceae bacterium]MBO6568415.1 hypothetical protein [Kordiimonadaceae bacterium]MBO6963856.1 hypothetical protein [Kordiimonadaceae bacterium]